MRIDLKYGTHLPVLIKLVGMTDGPILELGMGLYSTPYLHWACFDEKRKLVSYDNHERYFGLNEPYICDYHKIHLVEDWDKIDISGHWSVVFVDHSPAERRREEIKRLADSAEYIIIHDSEAKNDPHYKYSEIYPLFEYRHDYKKAFPQTTILSNFKKL